MQPHTKIRLPRTAEPYRTPQPDIGVYLRELPGAVDILRQAQDVEGDDHYMLMDLAAEAWLDARRKANLDRRFYLEELGEVELEAMLSAGVLPTTYAELSVIYVEKRLAHTRQVLAQIGA